MAYTSATSAPSVTQLPARRGGGDAAAAAGGPAGWGAADVDLADRARLPDRRPGRLARGERGHAHAARLPRARLRALLGAAGAVDPLARRLAPDGRRGGAARAAARRERARLAPA